MSGVEMTCLGANLETALPVSKSMANAHAWSRFELTSERAIVMHAIHAIIHAIKRCVQINHHPLHFTNARFDAHVMIIIHLINPGAWRSRPPTGLLRTDTLHVSMTTVLLVAAEPPAA